METKYTHAETDTKFIAHVIKTSLTPALRMYRYCPVHDKFDKD
jgi:hypothetical protein